MVAGRFSIFENKNITIHDKKSDIFSRLISQYPNGQLNISFGSITDLGTGFESETTKMIFILYTNKSESKPKRFQVNRDQTTGIA